jgi:putrescine aminotransferase
VRGLGLLIGLEFVSPEVGYAVSTALFGEGVLVGGTLFNAKTFRIEPPATLTQEQMEQVVLRLERVLGKVRGQLERGELAAH